MGGLCLRRDGEMAGLLRQSSVNIIMAPDIYEDNHPIDDDKIDDDSVFHIDGDGGEAFEFASEFVYA